MGRQHVQVALTSTVMCYEESEREAETGMYYTCGQKLWSPTHGQKVMTDASGLVPMDRKR